MRVSSRLVRQWGWDIGCVYGCNGTDDVKLEKTVMVEVDVTDTRD